MVIPVEKSISVKKEDSNKQMQMEIRISENYENSNFVNYDYISIMIPQIIITLFMACFLINEEYELFIPKDILSSVIFDDFSKVFFVLILTVYLSINIMTLMIRFTIYEWFSDIFDVLTIVNLLVIWPLYFICGYKLLIGLALCFYLLLMIAINFTHLISFRIVALSSYLEFYTYFILIAYFKVLPSLENYFSFFTHLSVLFSVYWLVLHIKLLKKFGEQNFFVSLIIYSNILRLFMKLQFLLKFYKDHEDKSDVKDNIDWSRLNYNCLFKILLLKSNGCELFDYF